MASMYLLFKFELLRNLHFGTSTFLKECTVKYLSSDRISMRTSEREKIILENPNPVLRGYHLLLESTGGAGKLQGF